MSKVLVIDTNKNPQNPIHPAQARQLLRNKKAAVYRRFPFTLILKESRPDAPVELLRIKIDPGSKTTGLALVNDTTGEAGRITTRATGSFNISTKNGLVQGISHKFCQAIHRKDGYGYAF